MTMQLYATRLMLRPLSYMDITTKTRWDSPHPSA